MRSELAWLESLPPEAQAALLTELQARLAECALADYRPYKKQREFHRAGARFRERLFMAGNQLGKCAAPWCEIDRPDGGLSALADLHARQDTFDVISSFGPITVGTTIEKMRAEIVRLYLSNGAVLDVATSHVVLLFGGSYCSVAELLNGYVFFLPRTIVGRDRSTHDEDARDWRRIIQDFRGDCPICRHFYDGQLLGQLETDQLLLTSQVDVRPRIQNAVSFGDLADNKEHSHHYQHIDRRASLDGDLRHAGLCVECANRVGYMFAQCSSRKHREQWSIHAELKDRPRSFVSALSDQDEKRGLVALRSPFSCEPVFIIAWNKLGRHSVFDMSVPFAHDYSASGVINHNTIAGGFETGIHLTGRYPDWWDGKVFEKQIVAWAAGVTSEATRDNPQRILMGRKNAIGTGAIPKDAILDKAAKRGVADAIDTVVVAHGGGGDVQAGQSLLGFKSYDQGREKFQGETLQLAWLDEEPPADVYTETVTRTNTTSGIVAVTFTPLLGMSTVVTRFLLEKPEGTHVTSMTIDDAEHYTPEQRRKIIAAYPAHERDARARGIPVLGSGRVFPIEEGAVVIKPIQIPDYWPRIAGIDFGWDHPTAAVLCAWDRDTDTFYVVKEHRLSEATPIIHAATIKGWGAWIPVAWPHDGLQHDKGSGEQLAKQYKEAGLKMLNERATFEDGSNGVEAGLSDMLTRMQTGRWKVFNTCQSWIEEFRMYHRKDGKVVKERDDLISASRYAFMMRRKAVVKQASKEAAITPFTPLDATMGW